MENFQKKSLFENNCFLYLKNDLAVTTIQMQQSLIRGLMITAIKERKRQEKQRIQLKTASVVDQNSMSVH